MFFFSGRRRHTRCSRDWSSDVCSSDLGLAAAALALVLGAAPAVPETARQRPAGKDNKAERSEAVGLPVYKIGRASCRESVSMAVVAVPFVLIGTVCGLVGVLSVGSPPR